MEQLDAEFEMQEVGDGSHRASSHRRSLFRGGYHLQVRFTVVRESHFSEDAAGPTPSEANGNHASSFAGVACAELVQKAE